MREVWKEGSKEERKEDFDIVNLRGWRWLFSGKKHVREQGCGRDRDRDLDLNSRQSRCRGCLSLIL